MSDPHPVEKELLRMFGLEGRQIVKLVITCEVDCAPIVQVTEFMFGSGSSVSTYKIGDPIEVGDGVEVTHV
jgi:hypothetical protein